MPVALTRESPSMANGVGLRFQSLRGSWVRIPPPAPYAIVRISPLARPLVLRLHPAVKPGRSSSLRSIRGCVGCDGLEGGGRNGEEQSYFERKEFVSGYALHRGAPGGPTGPSSPGFDIRVLHHYRVPSQPLSWGRAQKNRRRPSLGGYSWSSKVRVGGGTHLISHVSLRPTSVLSCG